MTSYLMLLQARHCASNMIHKLSLILKKKKDIYTLERRKPMDKGEFHIHMLLFIFVLEYCHCRFSWLFTTYFVFICLYSHFIRDSAKNEYCYFPSQHKQ